jgi:hypothetical protein
MEILRPWKESPVADRFVLVMSVANYPRPFYFRAH